MRTLSTGLIASVVALAFTGVANAAVVNDTFTGTDNTLLQNHVGETGATWTKHPNYPTDLRLFGNRAYGAEWAMYTASGVPSSSEYDVSATLTVKSNVGAVGVVGRATTSGTDALYMARYNAGATRWELVQCSSGSCSNLGTYSQTLTVGVTYAVKLQIRNATKKLFVDGVERASSTHNSIAGPGRAGIRQGPLPTTASTAAGYHVDNFVVDNVAPDTTITSGPTGTTSDNTPTFTFSSSITPATFECKLDGPGGTLGSWASCSSPHTTATLADGTYTMNVRATAGGLTDPVAATQSFTVATGGSGPPSYTVTFQDSFEGASFPQTFATGAWNAGVLSGGSGWYFNQITPSGYSAVDGTKVADSGLTSSSQRSEIQCHRSSSYGPDNNCAGGLGSEWFYEWSFRIPTTVAIPDQPHDTRPNLMQTKPEQGSDPSCYGGGMVVRRHPTDSAKFDLRQNIRGGTITSSSSGCTFATADTVAFLGSFAKGVWHRVVLHAKWDATNAGFEEIWINGTQVLTKVNRPTVPTTLTKQDFRLGLYNSINNAAWNVQYDHVKVGIPTP